MAGAGGTAPKKQDDIEALREALIPELMKHLGGEVPTAPQYQPAPISPMQGYAMARNPQQAGLINQTIQAPAQAQFAQQQAAFEQAMGQRQQATGLAAGLVNAQTRTSGGVGSRSIKSEVNRDVNGTTHKFVQFFDPQTNELLGEHDLGPVGYAPAMLASPEGYQRAPKTGGAATPVLGQSGQPIYPPPPAGVVTSVAAGTATLGGLEDLRQAYKDIRSKTEGQWTAGQVVRQYAGESRLGGALAPDYANYTASRRAALNAYIKGQTGAQFSVKELQRYEAQYPEPWDPEDVADNKINVLEQRALADMQAKLRAFPGASGAAPQQAAPKRIKRSNFNQLSPDEQQRALRDGVQVIEGQ